MPADQQNMVSHIK
ncbi:hypothetical protein A2U01_0116091, partial [Trifolium medium]|nr:hypothetical protein [Trifolium medium]